jgi:hypothetical protein
MPGDWWRSKVWTIYPKRLIKLKVYAAEMAAFDFWEVWCDFWELIRQRLICGAKASNDLSIDDYWPGIHRLFDRSRTAKLVSLRL